MCVFGVSELYQHNTIRMCNAAPISKAERYLQRSGILFFVLVLFLVFFFLTDQLTSNIQYTLAQYAKRNAFVCTTGLKESLLHMKVWYQNKSITTLNKEMPTEKLELLDIIQNPKMSGGTHNRLSTHIHTLNCCGEDFLPANHSKQGKT